MYRKSPQQINLINPMSSIIINLKKKIEAQKCQVTYTKL